jgi:hypothetical protein
LNIHREPSLVEVQDAIREAGGIDHMAKAAKKLRRKGYAQVSVQYLRLVVSRMDNAELGQHYASAKERAGKLNAQAENNLLRRDVRSLAAALETRDNFYDAISSTFESLGERPPVDYKKFYGPVAGKPMTVELLLSDLQIGKLAPGYNTPIAKRRLFEFGRAALFQIEKQQAAGYRIERIVLAMIGDIIESDKKHKNSARATDTGTAEQLADAMESIFLFVIEPLARLGIPMDVVGVTGNHDWDDHGLNMFEPGKQQLSWPMYKSMEFVTKRSGYANVTFTIPEGSYTILDFYGQKVLYEHGVGVSANETSMKAHKIKRSEQEKQHLTYFRMGDKHIVNSFNAGALVVNGSFFGATKGGTEYSGIAGYDSVPAQWMGFHVPRDDARMTLYDSFTIQLEHVGEAA